MQFLYSFDPKASPGISTRKGLFGVDADGDGSIRIEQFSVETSYAEDDEVVMRIGSDLFVSTSRIDLAFGEVTVRRRERAEYLRVELAVGMEMPDFHFVDFAGRSRKLSEFRGKFVLVDFWGIWCPECVQDIPFQLAAHKRFAPAGFEIVGLNWDDRWEDAAAFLTKHGATWPQARKESIRRLTEVTYRIQEYPSLVLLDREGRVVTLEQDALQGIRLEKTLEKVVKLTVSDK